MLSVSCRHPAQGPETIELRPFSRSAKNNWLWYRKVYLAHSRMSVTCDMITGTFHYMHIIKHTSQVCKEKSCVISFGLWHLRLLQMRFCNNLLTPPATAERSVAAALRIWFTRRDFFIFFFCSIFAESSEPMGLKFGHDAWITELGPKETIESFIAIAFVVF